MSEILLFLGWIGILVTLGLGYLFATYGESEQDSREHKAGFFSKTWAVMILGMIVGVILASLVQPEFPMRSLGLHFNIFTVGAGVTFGVLSGLMCQLGKRNGSNFNQKRGRVVHEQA